MGRSGNAAGLGLRAQVEAARWVRGHPGRAGHGPVEASQHATKPPSHEQKPGRGGRSCTDCTGQLITSC